MRILSMEITVIAHATEDPTKVSRALRNVFPEFMGSETKVTTQYLQGHHGNPIRILKTNVMKRKIIDQFFDHLMKSLNTDDLGTIANDVDKHIDEEGNLYLRLNKQAAYMGEVRLRQEDPIRIKMKLIDDVGRGKPQMELVRKLIEDYEKIR